MAHLLRIIMIHGHLQGVVELDLQGHSNICGTNASGKTTLQRLIPVFYGENPNKVVPKTRKKFDQYYLPHSNSYLVYEYLRENNTICMAVLTRKSDEGIEYRFIQSPYLAELFLQTQGQDIQAVSYTEFASRLRQQQIDSSKKLDTISSYRCVIQNDFSQNLSRQESSSLRQIALQYSLAPAPHRLRHIEKLVSAVHAKEGKMDTLKTMLAAILEEDGVALPVTQIKSQQVHDWRKQVQQSKRLSVLQKQYQQLELLHQNLSYQEATLYQLQPKLINQQQKLNTDIADNEAHLSEKKQQLSQCEETFNQQRHDYNGQISQYKSDLNACKNRLDSIETQFQVYEEKAMPELEKAMQQLPAWREQVEQLQQHKKRLDQAAEGIQQKYHTQLAQLLGQQNSSKDRIHQKIDQLRQEQNTTQKQQDKEREALQNTHQEHYQQQKEQLHTQQNQLQIEKIHLDEQLRHDLSTEQEIQQLQSAQAQIDDLQEQIYNKDGAIEQLNKQYQTQKITRDSHLETLKDKQNQRYLQQQSYDKLKQQLEPKAGSLREFLHHSHPHWQHNLGKVIDEALLERRDLSPKMCDQPNAAFYGMTLDLSAIALPSHALDQQQLQLSLEQCNRLLNQYIDEEQNLTKQQQTLNQNTQQAQQALEQETQNKQRLKDDWQLAKHAKNKLHEQLNALKQQRKKQLLKDQQALEEKISAAEHTAKKQLEQIKTEFKQFLLEKTAAWQENLHYFDGQISQLQQELKTNEQTFKQQKNDIEQLQNQELSHQGVDVKKLNQLSQQISQLEDIIHTTQRRRDELHEYRRFIKEDYQIRKPELLEQEHQYTQTLRQLEAQLAQLNDNFKQQQKSLQQAQEQIKNTINQQKLYLPQLDNAIKRIEQLALDASQQSLVHIPEQLEALLDKVQYTLDEHFKTHQALRSAVDRFESDLNKEGNAELSDMLSRFSVDAKVQDKIPTFANILHLLNDRQAGLIDEGRNFGKDLSNFFKVFKDLNQQIQKQSQRLSDEVNEEFVLEGIHQSSVKIQSSIDELNFWQPLKQFAELHKQWENHAELPSDAYLDSLAEVANLLRSGQQFSFESLLRIELHLNEGGSDLIIRNDRQLLESSSHGMAYLILCKYLLAFTRLLRGEAELTLHWPIDEIGTLAYHNVEKLFKACDNNHIYIVGAFPNPESEVLSLFKQRYLIEKSPTGISKLKRIEAKLSRLSQKLQQHQEQIA